MQQYGGMSKKIDKSLSDLIKALRHHAKVVSSKPLSLKKSERAVVRVQTAMEAYAAAVSSETGFDRPFVPVSASWLDELTLDSLAAERDALAAEKKSGAKKETLSVESA
jgi:hypothetical protein